jgi:serine/threonine protein kinase
MDSEEVKAVEVLLRRILQYDPAKRPSAASLLKDPWFEGIEVSNQK